MAQLEPCPTCQRHVRISESACPFCGGDVREAFSTLTPRAAPRTRLGRAALFAFGITAAASAIPGCGDDGDDEGDKTSDAGQNGSEDGGATDGGQAGGNNDDSGGVVALYGAAPPEDAGMGTPSEDAGVVAIYGAAPSDQG